MADISVLSRLVAGIQRNVDLTSNTLVLSSLKLGTSELTKAKLDLLAITVDSAAAVDASAQHHHDGRYFTESEMGSTANGSAGASLVGVDQTPAFTNFSGATVQAALESIDTALGSAGGTVFADDVFRVQDNADATKQIAFEASAITTGTTRTVTMPDANVDLGDISTNTTNIGTNTTNIGNNDTDIADLVTLSGVAANSTDLGSFSGLVISDNTTVKNALQQLETKTEANTSLINNFEWKDSVLDIQTDATLDPGASPATGARYIITNAAALHANFGTITGVADDDIVQYDGVNFVVDFTPTVAGPYVSSDADASSLYLYGGASWDAKAFEATTASTGLTKVGFDIRLADASVANGIIVSSGAISVSLATDPGLEFNAGALRVLVDPAGALERVAAGLDVKNLGIDNARLAANAVTDAKVDAAAAIAHSKMAALTASRVAVTDGSGVVSAATATSAQLATLTDGSEADALHTHGTVSAVAPAGEAYTAAGGPYAVRYGVTDLDTPENGGRVYKADPTELSLVKTGGNKDPFHVAGIANPGSDVSIAGNITIVKTGKLTVSTHGFAVGEPIYLAATGALTSTPPSTSGEAAVKIGVARDSNTIDVQIQIMGVA